MDRVKLGYEWEKRAENILIQLGFSVIKSCKNIKNTSPYDILVKRNSKTYAVNVKYSAKCFAVSAKNLQRLVNLNSPIPVLLFINECGYIFTEVTESTGIADIIPKDMNNLKAVKITVQKCKGYKQYRITLPAGLVRALGWKTGDDLKPMLHRRGLLFRRIEEWFFR